MQNPVSHRASALGYHAACPAGKKPRRFRTLIQVLAVAAGTLLWIPSPAAALAPGADSADDPGMSIHESDVPALDDIDSPDGLLPIGEGDAPVRFYWDVHTTVMHELPSDAEADNPYISGAFVGVPWSSIEPARGVFDFSALEEYVSFWAGHGKGVILKNGVLGFNGAGVAMPGWIDEEGVPYFQFMAREDDPVFTTMPLVWDSAVFMELYEEYVAALAAQYDGDPRIDFVWIGTGQHGYTTADSSAGGAEALPENGWTPEEWETYLHDVIDLYARHFEVTPLVLAASPLWTKAEYGDDIAPAMESLAVYAADRGVSLLLNGLDPSEDAYERTPFSEMLDALSYEPLPEGFTLMMGDDSPLWLDPMRRARRTRDAERDELGLAAALDLALAEWDRIDRQGNLIIKLLDAEAAAVNPNLEAYQPTVAQTLRQFVRDAGSGGTGARPGRNKSSSNGPRE